MIEDGAPRRRNGLLAANDNDIALEAVDAALTRVAEAIARHIAREHIRTRKAANDNEPIPKNPKPSAR